MIASLPAAFANGATENAIDAPQDVMYDASVFL
jgi:hypothetical protein